MVSLDKSALINAFKCGSDQRAEKAALQLATHGSSSLELLKELLNHPEADVRWWATRALAEIPVPETIELTLVALQDQDPAVQQCATLALQHQPHPAAIPQLINALDAPDRLLGRLAGDALIAIANEAVPALIQAAENHSQSARLEAVRALSLIGDTRSIPVLFKILGEDSAVMEYWAEQGLEKMGVGMVFFKP